MSLSFFKPVPAGAIETLFDEHNKAIVQMDQYIYISIFCNCR